jgi:hypothetical protein
MPILLTERDGKFESSVVMLDPLQKFQLHPHVCRLIAAVKPVRRLAANQHLHLIKPATTFRPALPTFLPEKPTMQAAMVPE